MSEQEKRHLQQYELSFSFVKGDSSLLPTGRITCVDFIHIDFEPQTGKYFVMNLEGPDAWQGEDEDKLEAVLKYLRARLGLATQEEKV